MPLTVCPATKVNASLEKIWSLLYEPAKYDTWADANIVSIKPSGYAQTGQIIKLTSRSVGIKWNISMNVINVDKNRHCIFMETHLPFNLTLKNTISCIAYDERTCLVRYGWEAIFPSGFKGRILELLLSKPFEKSIEDSLFRLKDAAEKL